MSVRAFVAVTPPETVRQVLSAPLARFGGPGIRPVPASHLHLTLAFLEEVSEEDGRAVAGFLAMSAFDDGMLETATAVLFPSEARPRVLAVEVRDPSGALGRMRERVVAFLRDRGVAFDDRKPFRPHLTLARFGGEAVIPARLQGMLEAVGTSVWPVGRPVLYRSELERGRPPRYSPVLP